MNELKNPMQPLFIDKYGVVRFKENKIVRYVLDNGGIDMNHLAKIDFTRDDEEQFAQLIGYSVGGFAELSYVTDETYSKAQKEADDLYKNDNHLVNCMICEKRIEKLTTDKITCYSCSNVAHNNDKCGHRVYVEKYWAHHTYCCNNCSVFCDGCSKYIYKNEPHNH